MSEPDERIKVGSVVQINEKHGRLGWMGAFLLVTELKSWGVMGFVHVINTHEDPPGFAYIRLKFEEVDYIGQALLVPDESDGVGEKEIDQEIQRNQSNG